MARKLNFDPPPVDPEQAPAEVQENAVQRLRPLMGLGRTTKPPSALGAITQSLGNISERAKRAEEIEQKLVEGQVIIDLDPALIEGSFVPDRMEATEEQNASFRELIRSHGQNVPILVRPKPDQSDRYEVAFGHRRLRAARELGIKVRAVVRALSDEQLVIAQGQENSGRTDLTFIERARFAARLEERQFSRETIMASLNVDKAALSRLISIATRIPPEIIDAIGPAPSFGRVRWQELTDALAAEEVRKRALVIVVDPDFALLDTDKRFETLTAKLREAPSRARPEIWAAADGTHAAKIARAGSKLTLAFDDRTAPNFGDFVRQKLQSLYEEFKASSSST